MNPADLARERAAAFEAGVAVGRRQAAEEALVRMKQLGLDLVRDAHRGAVSPLLGNSSGPGSVAALGGER
jgi:hypothetical protein